MEQWRRLNHLSSSVRLTLLAFNSRLDVAVNPVSFKFTPGGPIPSECNADFVNATLGVGDATLVKDGAARRAALFLMVYRMASQDPVHILPGDGRSN